MSTLLPEEASSSSSSSSSSESEVENKKPVKRVRVEAPAEEEEEEGEKLELDEEEQAVRWKIEKDVQLKVKKWKGSSFVDLRRYYEDKEGATKPTQKGIFMSLELFKKVQGLKKNVMEMVQIVESTPELDSSFTLPSHLRSDSTFYDSAQKAMMVDLNQGKHMLKVYRMKKSSPPLVDIRSFWNGAPTKKGISINKSMFERVFGWKGLDRALKMLQKCK